MDSSSIRAREQGTKEPALVSICKILSFYYIQFSKILVDTSINFDVVHKGFLSNMNEID